MDGYEAEKQETCMNATCTGLPLEEMTDRQLLEELVERLLKHQSCYDRMDELDGLASDVRQGEEWENLMFECDNQWCRVREIVRFVKGDDSLWTC